MYIIFRPRTSHKLLYIILYNKLAEESQKIYKSLTIVPHSCLNFHNYKTTRSSTDVVLSHVLNVNFVKLAVTISD